jgi:hypothetical protein
MHIMNMSADWTEHVRRILSQPLVALEHGNWEFEMLRLYNINEYIVWPLFKKLCLGMMLSLVGLTFAVHVAFDILHFQDNTLFQQSHIDSEVLKVSG